jgi:CIC family chloride channel protein
VARVFPTRTASTSVPIATRWRKRAWNWLRGSAPGLVLLAVVVGAGAGAGAVLFRYLILWFTELFTGRADYSDAGRATSPNFAPLGIFFVLVVPVIGGLVYGPIVDRFAREARGHGVPEVMLAVAENGGRIGRTVPAVKSLASALCIGSGGSVGREGPIVQIGSALGSTLGQGLRVPESRLRLLVACGAAGGISATFNAPIAGVFFALELILRDFEAEAFGVVVLSSVTAAVVGHAAFGDQPFLVLPAFTVASPVEFAFYAVLGVAAALIGVGFTRVLYGIEDLCDRAWRWPEWLRPGAGGLLLGLLLLALPEMYGVGYPVLQNGIEGKYVAWFLIILLLGKIFATSLTIGIGGSGGVFAPSLFMGAMLGSAFGYLVHLGFPGLTAPAGAYGLVGMGAVFAGAARAPITAVLIIFELTGEYSIILPLMVAIVLATAVSRMLSRDTIYTLKLRRRGIDILRGRSANLLEILTVGDAMRPVPATLSPDMPLDEVIERLAAEGRDSLPVIDTEGTYRGAVTSHEVREGVADNALETTAGSLARTLPTLPRTETLQEALQVLVHHEGGGLPVVSDDGTRLVGWIDDRDILRTYGRRLRSSIGHEPSATPRPLSATVGQRDGGQPTGHGAEPPAPTAGRGGPSPAGQDQVVDLRDYCVVDIELTDSQPPAGLRITEVPWPPASHLVALRRDGATIAAATDTVLRKSDRLTVLVPSDQTPDDVAAALRGRPGTKSAGPAEDIVR